MCGLCILSVSCTGEELNERVEVLGQRWTSLSPKNWFSFFIQRCRTNIAILAIIKTIVAVGDWLVLPVGSLGSVCRVSPGLADLSIPAYRKPPGTKDPQCALFSLAKTLPKHTSPLPHTLNAAPTEGLTEKLGTAGICIYSFCFLTWLAAWPACHFDPGYDWLEI